MERECLDLLLRGRQPVVICPARAIEGMRLLRAWRAAVGKDRLLILSPFGPKHRRVTIDLAERRNRFVADVAHLLLVPHASQGGKIERLCLDMLSVGKRVLTFGAANGALLNAGVQTIDPQAVLATLFRS
jgi:hypothetical protein